MQSRDIKDHRNIGLNADWCISTYQLPNSCFIFDNEDSTYTLSLVDVPKAYKEEAYSNFHAGTFAECIDAFNENQE